VRRADGQTKSIKYANNVTTTFLYDENRRWLSRVYTVNAAGVWLMDSQYTRDPAIGRIDKITGLTTDENWTYYYDDLDRLTYAGNAGDWTRAETFIYAANDSLQTLARDTTLAAPGDGNRRNTNSPNKINPSK
jgi:hypothetical protein